MSRLGRSQPVQPTVWHGLGEQGQNVLFVPLDAQRQRLPVPPAVVVSGALLRVTQPAVAAPPPPVSVDRVDQRARRQPQDAIVLNGLLAGVPVAATPAPPAPFLVPLDDRRRFLASLPPNVTVGFDDIVPPGANIVEPDNRRRRLPTPDPFTASSAGAATAPAPATPPPPFIVPVDQRGRFLVVLPSTGQHGFVDPGPGPVGTTPPPPLNVDRVDPRYGRKPLDPLVLSGVLVPFVPPPPPPTNAVQDMAPFISNW